MCFQQFSASLSVTKMICIAAQNNLQVFTSYMYKWRVNVKTVGIQSSVNELSIECTNIGLCLKELSAILLVKH
jgi:hypothetical protein